VLDGIPKHLPSLLRAEKLVKKARKSGLLKNTKAKVSGDKQRVGRKLFELAQLAQRNGWSAEELLRAESARREREWRKIERRSSQS